MRPSVLLTLRRSCDNLVFALALPTAMACPLRAGRAA